MEISGTPRRVGTTERLAVGALPDLTARIDAMGLSQEYSAFRDRYQGWRRGEASGAVGELNPEQLIAKQKGFGYWYPSTQVWTWHRTLSYWISVTFFEGSLFFTISSFLACYPDALGPYKKDLTTMGYVAGKVNFIICTYFMCLETINLHSSSHGAASEEVGTPDTPVMYHQSHDNEVFYWWPFYYRTALANLEKVGAGPWPYYASAIYFIGVLLFLVGLIAEFMSFLPHHVVHWTVFVSFLLGSLAFVGGGLAECIENSVFSSLKCDKGWWGALLNTMGGAGFLFGSIIGYPGWAENESIAYAANFSFGIGSVIFAAGSATMIVMWKDEQFGLTFLSALNNLGGATGRPVVVRTDGIQQFEEARAEEEHTFTIWGSLFVMIYCFAATMSIYNFLTTVNNLDIGHSTESIAYISERTFNALLPAIFAHLMLALNAAVIKTPTEPPFRQLYIGCRFIALLMTLFGTANLVDTINKVAGSS